MSRSTEILVGRWRYYYEFKRDFYNGYDEINIEEFTDLVNDTYCAIKEMRHHIDNNDFASLNPDDIYQFAEMISVMARYSEFVGHDDSEKYVYTATGLLTSVLVGLISMDSWSSKLEKGVIEATPGERYGIGKKAEYDVNKGDLSDYLEIANEMME